MKYYCTYCCKNKIQTLEKVPAIDLYISKRIKSVYQKSKEDNFGFIILSGKFGFLFPEDKIPYYDKLLVESEVQDLSLKLSDFIIKNNISEITFFYRDFSEDKNVINYYNAVKLACEISKIKFLSNLIEKK